MNASASASGSSGDEGGLFGGSSDEEEEEEEEEEEADAETIEERRRIKLLGEEMGDLERAIAAKEGELKKAGNPIFKVRPRPFLISLHN
jgi:transcription initiation factor TFIID subunit 7